MRPRFDTGSRFLFIRILIAIACLVISVIALRQPDQQVLASDGNNIDPLQPKILPRDKLITALL
jgi:hypothetical protein